MGEVGTNSADSPHADLKMNGGINGNCDDELEAMDVDARDTSNEEMVKNVDSTETSDAKENAMETDNGDNSDGVQLTTSDTDKNDSDSKSDITESIAHENGAAGGGDTTETKEACDQKQIEEAISGDSVEKNLSICDNASDQLGEDGDLTVKELSDPLSPDAKSIDDDDNDNKRTNQSRSGSTENGISATIRSSNDEGNCYKSKLT